MRLIIDQEPEQDVVKVLTDEVETGLLSGDFVVSEEIAEQIKQFLDRQVVNG